MRATLNVPISACITSHGDMTPVPLLPLRGGRRPRGVCIVMPFSRRLQFLLMVIPVLMLLLLLLMLVPLLVVGNARTHRDLKQ